MSEALGSEFRKLRDGGARVFRLQLAELRGLRRSRRGRGGSEVRQFQPIR